LRRIHGYNPLRISWMLVYLMLLIWFEQIHIDIYMENRCKLPSRPHRRLMINPRRSPGDWIRLMMNHQYSSMHIIIASSPSAKWEMWTVWSIWSWKTSSTSTPILMIQTFIYNSFSKIHQSNSRPRKWSTVLIISWGFECSLLWIVQ